MPLHRDYELRPGALQGFDHPIHRADGGNRELLSWAIDRLVVARIDKESWLLPTAVRKFGHHLG
jgi:hypothetical protein